MIQNSSLLSDSRWDIYVQKRTMPAPGYRVKLLNLLEQRGIVRARDLTAAGIPLVYLHRLTAAGEVLRLGRGLYQRPDRAGEHAAHDLAEAAVRVPSGVISLISALRFHDLTTELPRAVWMTIPQRTRTPRADGVRLEIVRASGRVMTSGIENVEIEGVRVPIYGVAKTIADCFKHRRRVGEALAVEALRDALRRRKTTPAEVAAFAEIDRVTRVVGPYIERFR